jgi:hypothetical protein
MVALNTAYAAPKNAADPKTASGRSNWPSRDPLGEYGGLNLYRMMRNTTINSVDVLGLVEYGPDITSYDELFEATGDAVSSVTDGIDENGLQVTEYFFEDGSSLILEEQFTPSELAEMNQSFDDLFADLFGEEENEIPPGLPANAWSGNYTCAWSGSHVIQGDTKNCYYTTCTRDSPNYGNPPGSYNLNGQREVGKCDDCAASISLTIARPLSITPFPHLNQGEGL